MLIYNANLEFLDPMWLWWDPWKGILVCGIELIFASAIGLLAIWGGLGRAHWFARAVVLLASLALWLVVPAHEPMLVYFVQTALVAVMLAWTKRRRAMPDRLPQFAMRDVLLGTVVMALVSAAAAQVPVELRERWWMYPAVGTVYGLLTLLAAWVVLGRSRWWLRAIGGCVGFPSVLLVGWLLLARWSGLLDREPPGRASLRYAARVGAVVVSLLIVLPSVFVYHVLVTPTPIPVAELPEPNGHNDLMRAAKALGNVISPEREDGVVALQAFVGKYTPNLRVARTGLDHECKVPVRYDRGYSFLDNVQGARNLAQAFRAEGVLAEEEGRTEDAMRSHFDIIRLAYAAARSGLVVDRLTGVAIMGIGLEGLNDLCDELSLDQCRELIEMLATTTEAGWEPLEDYLARDRAWDDHAFGWRARIRGVVYSISGNRQALEDAVASIDLETEARKRLLIATLAIRCYELERGELPDTLADLVPKHLPEVPEDPFRAESLIYRRTGDGHVLYSVGKDGLDNGGHRLDPKDTTRVNEDLFLGD